MNQKRRTSWDEGFSKRYDEWAASMTEDVSFYVELARDAPEGPLVELGVGRGRVAIPVARATRRVVIAGSPARCSGAVGAAPGALPAL